jgi:hypothetical protein
MTALFTTSWNDLVYTENVADVTSVIDKIYEAVIKKDGKAILTGIGEKIIFSIDGAYDFYKRMLPELDEERTKAGLAPINYSK